MNFTIRAFDITALLAAMALLAPTAAAQEETAPPTLSVSTNDLGSGGGDDGGALLLTGKIGGIVSFNGLRPFAHGALEVGYVFGGLQRTIGVYLAAEYTAPKTTGTVTEEESPERIADGSYNWEIRQKQLVLQPTFLYRFTWLSDVVVPFAGIGPRVYLLESVVRGSAGGERFADTKETSTKFGFGLPLGVEIPLGPGGLMTELLFQWGPLEHRTTGSTHLGGVSAFLGYRALL